MNAKMAWKDSPQVFAFFRALRFGLLLVVSMDDVI